MFVWAPEEEGQFQPGRCSKWWLKQTLKDLAQQLETLGSCLIIRQAHDSTEMLLQLAQVQLVTMLWAVELINPASVEHSISLQSAIVLCCELKPFDDPS